MKLKVEERERRGVKGALLVGKSKREEAVCCCYCYWKREKRKERECVSAKNGCMRSIIKNKLKSMYRTCTVQGQWWLLSNLLDGQWARPFAR